MDENNQHETVSTDQIESRIKEYQAKLKEWDAKTDQLDAEARIEFEKERDRFSTELGDAYQDLAEAKLREYAARIEASYQQLKTRWEDRFSS